MFETVINLKPQSEWRAGMTMEKLIDEMDKAVQLPGVSNAWTMPIKARTDMLSTGIRTPIGIKVFGKDLVEIDSMGVQVRGKIALARYGLPVGDLLEVIGTALGGEMVTTTVEGLERYGVTVRYPRELREDPEAIATQVLVPAMGGAMVPLGQVAKVSLIKAPPGIRTENALLAAYIYVDIRDRDIGGYVSDAQKAVRDQVKFPAGYYATWSGQFEYMERAKAKLVIVVPLTGAAVAAGYDQVIPRSVFSGRTIRRNPMRCSIRTR